MREVQKRTRMRMRDLSDFIPMFPNGFPTLSTIRHPSRRSKVHAQNFVFDENETNFAHVNSNLNVPKDVQLTRFNRFTHG